MGTPKCYLHSIYGHTTTSNTLPVVTQAAEVKKELI